LPRAGVSTIGLHLVARPLRNQGGGDDPAVQTLAGEVSMQHVPARARLVGEDQLRGLGVEPADELVDVGLTGPDRTHVVGGIVSMSLGVGDRDRVLVNIQTDEKRSRL